MLGLPPNKMETHHITFPFVLQKALTARNFSKRVYSCGGFVKNIVTLALCPSDNYTNSSPQDENSPKNISAQIKKLPLPLPPPTFQTEKYYFPYLIVGEQIVIRAGCEIDMLNYICAELIKFPMLPP